MPETLILRYVAPLRPALHFDGLLKIRRSPLAGDAVSVGGCGRQRVKARGGGPASRSRKGFTVTE
jgi:hypothetical protein